MPPPLLERARCIIYAHQLSGVAHWRWKAFRSERKCQHCYKMGGICFDDVCTRMSNVLDCESTFSHIASGLTALPCIKIGKGQYVSLSY